MQVRTIKSHKSMKLLAILLIAAVGVGLWLMPQKGGLPLFEVDRLIRPTPHGKFNHFNSLDEVDARPEEFISDIATVRHLALDPRVRTGQKESVASQYYLPSGDRVEFEQVVTIKEATPTTVRIEKKGAFRMVGEDWKEFREIIDCRQKIQHLSSGVARPSLNCEISKEDAATALEQEIQTCRVEPFGPRSRKSKVNYGIFKTKRGQEFDRSTSETISVDGEIVCGDSRKGRGRETSIMISTVQQPTVQDPAIGSRKRLFLVRTIVTQTGAVVFRSRNEILSSQTPSPSMPRLKLADKKAKPSKISKSLKGSGKNKKVARRNGKKVARR